LKTSTIKVGTRGSALALAQTGIVVRRLRELHPNLNFEIVPIKTQGDRIKTAAALRAAGKGLFVKEIERALLRKQVSLAIHSMKDLPGELAKGLALGAVPERVDPSDVFIGRTTTPIDQLPDGARIATSSLRRQALLKSLYPRFAFAEIKGNLDTRLAKLRDPKSNLEGIIVAAAGLRRLYGDNGIETQPLPKDKIVPAAGQGVLALEIRENDEAMRKILAPLHDPVTAAFVEAERELQRRLEGGCQVPLGVYAEASRGGVLTLNACLGTVDGRRILFASHSGAMNESRKLAETVEAALVAGGAREILAALAPRRAAAKKKPKAKPRKRR